MHKDNGGATSTTTSSTIASSRRFVPLPDDSGHGGVSKVERYKWAPIETSIGVFMRLPKAQIWVDPIYQRDQVSEKKVLEIAARFSWVLFGALSVVCRGKDVYAVFEGQHRLLAAMKRSEIIDVPCLVFRLESIAEEANAFLDLNQFRSAVAALDKHRAAIVAGRPTAILASEILAEVGYQPGKSSGQAFTTKAVRVIERAVEVDADSARSAVHLTAEIAEGEQLAVQLLRGLFWLIRKHPEVARGDNRRKLITAGQEALKMEMRRHKALIGKGGERVEGEALRHYLNKSRRTRKIGDDSE